MTTPETLASIQALARTIHVETGKYVTYVENMHTHSMHAEVWIQRDWNDFESFRGTTNPSLESETTLEVMRDRLASWLVAYRHSLVEEAV